jgi:hypothetical protein
MTPGATFTASQIVATPPSAVPTAVDARERLAPSAISTVVAVILIAVVIRNATTATARSGGRSRCTVRFARGASDAMPRRIEPVDWVAIHERVGILGEWVHLQEQVLARGSLLEVVWLQEAVLGLPRFDGHVC